MEEKITMTKMELLNMITSFVCTFDEQETFTDDEMSNKRLDVYVQLDSMLNLIKAEAVTAK